MQQTKHTLTVTLPSDLEIVMTRAFDAPQTLVFEAFTKPEHIRRWWGPAGSELSVCEMDVRPGGAWRYVVRMADGSEHPFKGVYQEIVEPERIAKTLIYDVDFARDFPALETVVLEQADGVTTLTATVRHQTKEARDGHLSAGMERGSAECYDRLEMLLASMRTQ